MVVSNLVSTVSVFRNYGDGTFGPKTDYAIGYSTYSVVLVDVNGDGRLDIVTANGGSDDISVLLNSAGGPTSVLSMREPPREYALRQNYPNPFNPTTHVSFVIGHSTLVTLNVYDVLGREVATLINEVKQPGTYNATWDAGKMPSGVYFYRLTAGGYFSTRKMILMK